MTQSRWLAKHHLPGSLPYYVLSDTACHRLELKRTGKSLRQRPLVKRLMVLLHFSANQQLELLTSQECRTNLPEIYRAGASSYYFIDEPSRSLGWVCLDDGKNPQRVHTNVRKTAGNKKTIDQLRALAANDRFRLLVLTTAEPKAEQLRELFLQQPIRGVPIEIAAVAGLESLVLGHRRREADHGPL
jgi:hypothetical protein